MERSRVRASSRLFQRESVTPSFASANHYVSEIVSCSPLLITTLKHKYKNKIVFLLVEIYFKRGTTRKSRVIHPRRMCDALSFLVRTVCTANISTRKVSMYAVLVRA